jgi:iron-sulfur cluster repair protein YtfE (RIC family)
MQIDRDAALVRSESERDPTRSKWPSITACLTHDHRLLDTLLTEVEALVQVGDFATAAECFSAFQRRLAAHIEAEETLLFPRLELASGDQGPTRVMRHEHADIERALEHIARSLRPAANTPNPAAGLLEELGEYLAAHHRKEAHVLGPRLDANLQARGELAGVVARLVAFLEAPRAGCCSAATR